MKTTSGINDGITDCVKKVIFVYEDGNEITLDQITDWDFDFQNGTNSNVTITSILNNVEMMNKYNKNITSLHIEFKVLDIKNPDDKDEMFMDVPCSMEISRIRIKGDNCSCGDVQIELEGMVY